MPRARLGAGANSLPRSSRHSVVPIAVDDGDSVGIVICGKGLDGLFYVLGDWTCKLSPARWGRRAVDAYREFSADRIIAERNFGGAMVEHVIRTVDTSVSFREVTAARGKIASAEPIAALTNRGRSDTPATSKSWRIRCQR